MRELGGGADLLELLNLGLVKHGKDVGGGSLATLLGVLLASCPCSTLESGRGRQHNQSICTYSVPGYTPDLRTKGNLVYSTASTARLGSPARKLLLKSLKVSDHTGRLTIFDQSSVQNDSTDFKTFVCLIIDQTTAVRPPSVQLWLISIPRIFIALGGLRGVRKIIITVFINLHNSKYTVAGIQPLRHRAFLSAGALVTYIEESKIHSVTPCLKPLQREH